jgi:hypothetical protein
MVRRLGKLYRRRIINVNVNIVLAGVLALIPTVGIVHLTRYMGIGEEGEGPLTSGDKLIISGVTLISDVIFDVAIYYLLHWLANHWPNRWRKAGEDPDTPHLPFFKDATLVQFQRMMLSPVLYTIWLGTQFTLIKWGVHREWATVWGFVLGVGTARTLHTMWMLRSERARAKQVEQAVRVGP